ncbi:MAG TPA: M56 family metallopeptidase [Gemmatimonadaceae bacterium]|nr:M56 family metallopeptidase [Gemmatimonadaceae bacterium]
MVSNILSGFEFTNTSISMLMLLVKATLILVVALGITLSMQRASAGARHLVWLVTLATLLLVPALTAWAPIPLRILPAERKVVVSENAFDAAPTATPKVDKQTRGIEAPAAAAAPSTTASVESEIASSPILSGLSLIVFIWAIVVIAIAASLGYAAMLVKRIVNRARPLTSEDWLNPLYEVSDRLSLEEPPRLLRSDDAKMPFACGVVTPTIVLPAECDTWSLDRRRAVLLHELAHVRRHDLVGHTLGRLACAFYWFHPLVWTAAKQLRSESERACDDLALACGARATDYAEHLLDIVTSVKRDATPSVALAMARRKEFEGRMLAILDPDLRHSSPSRRQSAALIGSLALISLVVGAAAPAPRQETEPARNVATKGTDLDLANHYPVDGSYPNPKLEKTMQKSAASDAAPAASDAQSTSTLQATSTQTSQVLSFETRNAVNKTVQQGIQFGIKTGMSAAQSALSMLGSQVAKSDTDERPALLAKILATEGDANLRRIAAWGLNEYADQQVAADALARALRSDRDPSVREMAAWSLADAGHSAAAVEALSAALHDSNVEVRQTAAWALGNVGSRAAVEPLSTALADPSPEMRKRAAWALGNLDLKQAPPALINLLKDSDPETRETAAWALYEIEDPAAIGALEEALNREQNKELQIAYIRALAAVGEKSVDALKTLLESKDPEIRTIAVKALAGGHATGPWPRPWPQPRPYPNDR